jgi:hypothetical protein
MVHQYDLDTPKTSLENAYEEFQTNVSHPDERASIINKALGKEDVAPHTTREDMISLFNPNQDFIESYNIRTQREDTKKVKQENAKLFNEEGQPYEHLWKHDGFKELHDPLSNNLLIA